MNRSPHIKRSICKKCDRVQIPGYTMTTRLQNHSKNQKKANSDVLEQTCTGCGYIKRYPVGKNLDYELWCDRVRKN